MNDGEYVAEELYHSALEKIKELRRMLKIEISSRDYWRDCNESNARLRVQAEDERDAAVRELARLAP